MKTDFQAIEKLNETKYTGKQIQYALEHLGYNSFKNEDDAADKIEEAREFLDENLVGTSGIEEFVNDGIDDGIFFPETPEKDRPYIDVKKFADDLLISGDYDEDEDGSVYRHP